MFAEVITVIEDKKLEEMEQTIAQLNKEIQEGTAVSERIIKSYAVLKAHQTDLLREVISLLNHIEESSSTIQESVTSIKELMMKDIGKQHVMH